MGRLDLNDMSVASNAFAPAIVTLVDGAGRGPDMPCRSCIVKPDKANTNPVLVSNKALVDGTEYPLPDTDLPMPVTNTNQLFFSSVQLNAQIHILWRL